MSSDGSPRTEDPRALLLRELRRLLWTERMLERQALPELLGEVEDEELSTVLRDHVHQTRAHGENLERVFELLGERPEAERSQALEGLRQEHAELAGQIGTSTLRDLFDAGAAARAEHLEIAAYRGVVGLARELGDDEAARLLAENLWDEEQALERLETIAAKLTKIVAGT